MKWLILPPGLIEHHYSLITLHLYISRYVYKWAISPIASDSIGNNYVLRIPWSWKTFAFTLSYVTKWRPIQENYAKECFEEKVALYLV